MSPQSVGRKKKPLKVGARILVCRYPHNYICEVKEVQNIKINGPIFNYMVIDEYEEIK